MSITVQNITKYYGNQKALDNVSFEIKTGEIVGFLGPNGAGKSTMMKIITGYIPASSGKVYIDGIETGTGNLNIRKKIGYLPENNPLYPDMYVREYLSFVRSFYRDIPPDKKLLDKIIEITGLDPEQNKKIGALSKGYRQRVGLAQALIHNPEVLILDEPTSGLDPNQIIEIRNLIRETGIDKTVMLSTHIMQEVEAICHRIIIIDRGSIVANEEKEKIYSIISKAKQYLHVEFDRAINSNELTDIASVGSVKMLKENEYLIEADTADDIRPLIFSFAVRNNLTILSLQKKESNLEEVFRKLTIG